MTYRSAFSANITAPLPQTLVEWARNNFDLPKGSSEEGRIRFERTPHIVEPLLELSPTSPTEKVVAMKPTQSAATIIGLIFLSGASDIAPGHAMLIMPTDSMAQSFSKKRLDAVIHSVPSLAAKIGEAKSKDASNTILQKIFPGGSIILGGSNSPAKYRSESIRYLILDDFDGFETAIGAEGSPEELADRRTGTFQGRRKIYINSTVTVDGASNIQAAYAKSSQGEWQLPCPRCGHYQYFRLGGTDAEFGLKFERDAAGEVVDAWYECESCRGRIEETDKPWMRERGKYVHLHPDRETKGFKWNALQMAEGLTYSWKRIARMFLDAKHKADKGDDSDMITFCNTILTEPWKEKGEQPQFTALLSRCEPYRPLFVPLAKAFFLTAGVDVQKNRLEYVIYAWGFGEEAWLVYHGEIYGDPESETPWRQLETIMDTPFPCEEDERRVYHVVSIGVDANYLTETVKRFVRPRQPRYFALRGTQIGKGPVIGRPSKQDLTIDGKVVEIGSVELYPVGTDTAKKTLYHRLGMADGASPFHFFIGTTEEFFKQLTAEKLITRLVKGYPVQEWYNVRHNRRNEALDCTVYAYAAAIKAGLPFLAMQPEQPKQSTRAPERNEPHVEVMRRNLQQRTKFGRPKWMQR
jgi:terminase, large subunit